MNHRQNSFIFSPVLAAWLIVFLLFISAILSSCSGVTCRTVYELPDGTFCRWKDESANSGSGGGGLYVRFRECSNGREYLNPEWFRAQEVCTK